MNPQVLEFFVKMKDLMSGGLAKLAQNSQNTFTKIKSNIATATTSTRFMSNSVDELREKLTQVNEVRFGTVMKSEFNQASLAARKLETQISRLERRGTRGNFGRGLLSKAASYIGPIAIATGLMSLGTGSVKAAMDFQAQTKSYQVLTKSDSIGKDLALQLRQLKQDTIMGVSVYSNAQRMLSFGIDSSKIIPDLKMLGDVSMGDAQKLKRITLAFAETESAGKLTGRRLLQFVNAGFNPLLEISKKTGKSMGTLTEEMSKGGISAGMVEDAFKAATSEGGRFNHMMDQIAGTTYGKVKLLEGQWANFKIILGEQLMPVATKLLEWAREILIWVEKNGAELWIWIKGLGAAALAIKTVLTFIVPFVEGLSSAAVGLEATGVAATAAIGPLGLLVLAFTAITGAWIAAKTEREKYEQFKENAAKAAFSAETKSMSDDVEALERNGMKFKDAVEKVKSVHMNWVLDERGKNGMELQTLTRQFQDAKEKASNGGGLAGNYFQMKDRIELLQTAQDNWNQKKNAVSAYSASNIQSTGKINTKRDEDKSVAAGITGGGPRVINIKFRDMVGKLEIHAAGVMEGLDDMERKVEEHFLRILNSGASVQS